MKNMCCDVMISLRCDKVRYDVIIQMQYAVMCGKEFLRSMNFFH